MSLYKSHPSKNITKIEDNVFLDITTNLHDVSDKAWGRVDWPMEGSTRSSVPGATGRCRLLCRLHDD